MQDYDFHTHTKRGRHAVGEDQEYIESAIAKEYDLPLEMNYNGMLNQMEKT